MRHITRKRLLSFFLAMALILTFSPISAAATYAPEEHEIDEDVAVTIAMLFVWANIGESEWNRKTTVDNIIPMYNNSDEVCAYCINLKNGSTNAGYIIVSTNLYEPLIQEYSDTESIDISDGLNTESVSRSHLANNSDSRIYYYGPLNYSTSKMDVPVVMSENSSELSNYQNAVKYIELIKQYGLIPSVSTHDEDNGIVDPIEYLETRYPNKTIKNAGYYNIGDNSIYRYRIKEWNACAVYGVAAIIHYYLPTYSCNTIASHCEQIARDKGYATLTYNDKGEQKWNYYISLGNLAPFARECAAYYNLDKSISSSMLTWSTGTSEISNGRPILLSIWHSDQYEDHTVTAFAWTSFQIVEVDIYMNFFKVKAGYVSESRYVCYQTVAESFITKFV